jgi:hypothetical protein
MSNNTNKTGMFFFENLFDDKESSVKKKCKVTNSSSKRKTYMNKRLEIIRNNRSYRSPIKLKKSKSKFNWIFNSRWNKTPENTTGRSIYKGSPVFKPTGN